MSSALPRAFSQRGKTQVEVERENFEKFQAISIQKAINSVEAPVKEKHVRTAIIGTFQDNGGGVFHAVTDRLPLQENPIVCWKFCYTFHKILRDGHPTVLQEFRKYETKLIELGKLWGHLKDNYGKLIKIYTKLLVQKLKFHRKYSQIRGNLKIDDDEFDKFIGRDVDAQFEISADMMDYMDDILALQAGVFGSLDMSRSNSMTASGQCRLAPLVQCILESALLYDYIVKILFKLHSNLPPETLSGHRTRFDQQFRSLNQFFYSSKHLQYYRNLVQVPSLPEQVPNFLIASEVSMHTRPMVVVPEVVEDTLVDTAEPETMAPPAVPDRFDSMARFSDDDKRDKHMHDMKQEIAALKRRLRQMESDNHFELNQSTEELRNKEKEVEAVRQLLTQVSLKRDEAIREKEQISKEIDSRLDSADQKSQASDEKFNKLKEIYNKLREDHVALLRKNGETQKQLKKMKTEAEGRDEQLMQLASQLNVARNENAMIQESVQKEGNDSELMAMKSEVLQLKQENQDLTSKLESAQEAKEASHQKLTVSEESVSELNMTKMNLETQVRELEEQMSDLKVNLSVAEQTHQTEISDLEQREQTAKSTLAQNETKIEQLQKEVEEITSKVEEQKEQTKKEVENTQVEWKSDCMRYSKKNFENWVEFLVEANILSVRASPEMLIDIINRAKEKLDSVESKMSSDDWLFETIALVGRISSCVLFTKATANLSASEHGEKLRDLSSETAKSMSRVLEILIEKPRDSEMDANPYLSELRCNLELISNLADELRPQIKDVKAEEIDELVEHEMVSTTQAIEDAAGHFEELLAKSRSQDSGVQLEVNERIIDSCTTLMQNIRQLIIKSRTLQKEIVATGRGASTVHEYYKKHSRWTEGLLSASKSVAFAANALLECADNICLGKGKFEELIVCSQEIAACTTQLVIASQVKSDANSKALQDLKKASSSVATSTGSVVAQAKSCAEIRDEQVLQDLSQVSLTQSKRMEMNSQVKVLELESDLNKERVKLAALRKKHYQLAGESEGWDEEDIKNAESQS